MHAVNAVGCRLVLRVEQVIDPKLERAKKAGLVLASETEKDQERAQAGVDKGIVLAIGPNCAPAWIEGVNVGDEVAFAKYAGKLVTAKDNPEDKYLIINDEDVICTYRSING